MYTIKKIFVIRKEDTNELIVLSSGKFAWSSVGSVKKAITNDFTTYRNKFTVSDPATLDEYIKNPRSLSKYGSDAFVKYDGVYYYSNEGTVYTEKTISELSIKVNNLTIEELL